MRHILILFISILSYQVLLAWGKSGHLIVGTIADSYLTAKAKQSIKQILGEETLADAGLWMDIVANDKSYKNQDHWHYAYKDVVLEDNAIVKLEEFTALLQNSEAPQEEKLIALRSLIHIAADIHVPIHCGYMKDKGGHKGKLSWEDTGEKTNMHKVWDTDMIQRFQPDVNTYVSIIKPEINEDKIKNWGTRDFNVWVTESQELLDQVYDHPSSTLSVEYYNQNIVVVNDRLSMAAVRLAFLLNSIFDPI